MNLTIKTLENHHWSKETKIHSVDTKWLKDLLRHFGTDSRQSPPHGPGIF